MEKIKLGISTCLLGENVRYDGGHKLDRFLTKWNAAFPSQENLCISKEIPILLDWSLLEPNRI